MVHLTVNELQALQNLFRAISSLNNTSNFDPDRIERIRLVAEWIEIAEGLVSYPSAKPIDPRRVRETKLRLPVHYDAAKVIAAEKETFTDTQLKKGLFKIKLYTGPNGLQHIAEALEYDGIVSSPDNRGTRMSYRVTKAKRSKRQP